MAANDQANAELLAIMGRIERAQERFVAVADNMLAALEVHTEKLDAILEAATREPGPSPTAKLLKQIVDALTDQSETLAALPAAFARTVREEMERDLEAEIEAEGAEAWEPGDPGDRPQ